MDDGTEFIDLGEDAADRSQPSGVIMLHPEKPDLGTRLDKYLADQLPDMSRAMLQGLIEDGQVLVDGVQRKSKFRVTPGQVVAVDIPPVADDEIQPDPIPLEIVYEDADVIVVNKPAGMVVHPAPGHPRGTLANALVAHVPEIAVGGSHRPGIVHRLDKDTSGLIVAAKTDRGKLTLVDQWAARSVDKTYITLVSGSPEEDEATIDAPIMRDTQNRQRMAVHRNGRDAVSHFKVLERFPDATLLEVTIETGRTHQIRVHLAFAGLPVVGDPVYGRPGSDPVHAGRQLLHASRLGFELPNGSRVTFEAPLPEDFAAALQELRERERGDD
ncbi:MAG: RluA family pseudouridine synthase [Chloroflexota bacterium]|nr:RluA family pseudouridine synthase [Chloroflexota bacterium]